jgi:hypothetical protein
MFNVFVGGWVPKGLIGNPVEIGGGPAAVTPYPTKGASSAIRPLP